MRKGRRETGADRGVMEEGEVKERSTVLEVGGTTEEACNK